MKVAVCSSGGDLDSAISDVFGRSPYFLLVNTDDMSYEAIENPAVQESSGAGIMAAQMILDGGSDAMISCSLGPKAFKVLAAGSVSCYSACGGTVREVLDSMANGDLEEVSAPNVQAHSGSSEPKGREASQGDDDELLQLSRRLNDLREQVREIIREIDQLTKERT